MPALQEDITAAWNKAHPNSTPKCWADPPHMAAPVAALTTQARVELVAPPGPLPRSAPEPTAEPAARPAIVAAASPVAPSVRPAPAPTLKRAREADVVVVEAEPLSSTAETRALDKIAVDEIRQLHIIENAFNMQNSPRLAFPSVKRAVDLPIAINSNPADQALQIGACCAKEWSEHISSLPPSAAKIDVDHVRSLMDQHHPQHRDADAIRRGLILLSMLSTIRHDASANTKPLPRLPPIIASPVYFDGVLSLAYPYICTVAKENGFNLHTAPQVPVTWHMAPHAIVTPSHGGGGGGGGGTVGHSGYGGGHRGPPPPLTGRCGSSTWSAPATRASCAPAAARPERRPRDTKCTATRPRVQARTILASTCRS